MGKMSRDKGKAGEREVVHLLREHGIRARRGVQHKGGPDSPDVELLDADNYWDIGNQVHVEVKRTERFNAYDALDQATTEARDQQTPVVFHRRSGERWIAVMDADAFLDWMEQIYYSYQEGEADKDRRKRVKRAMKGD